ncbi:MAG: YhdH/YhfP family quinone oxidoreductase [Kurthia sp.]|nr:YhdH/YhfP family quinone oxidoreductase [Candidatus Kurthia equi]
MEKFQAIVVRQQDEIVSYDVEQVSLEDLSAGEVLIKVAYSSINYKDSLAVTPKAGVINTYPMIPGIDLSGVVVSSEDEDFVEGQEVLVTGFDMGMGHTGGFAEYARIQSNWIIPLPEGLSMRNAMIYGTAGFTAALSIQSLEKMGMNHENNPKILVTGASGGVGSIALQLLQKAGYQNIATLIRKDYQKEFVEKLGAHHIVQTDEIHAASGKLLAKQQYDYVIDTVGGEVTTDLLPQLAYGGSMTLCGNAGGINIQATVLPFILRGINLLGIDSVQYPHEARFQIWNRFALEWDIAEQAHVTEISLQEVKSTIEEIQQGRHVGRTIINMNV